MAIVGSSVVVGKLALARFPVFLLSGLRFAVAALILVPLVPHHVALARELVHLLCASSPKPAPPAARPRRAVTA